MWRHILGIRQLSFVSGHSAYVFPWKRKLLISESFLLFLIRKKAQCDSTTYNRFCCKSQLKEYMKNPSYIHPRLEFSQHTFTLLADITNECLLMLNPIRFQFNNLNSSCLDLFPCRRMKPP